MDAKPSISEMVAMAVNSGIKPRPRKRRRDKAAREAEMRALQNLISRDPADDSDFDDYCMMDELWNKRYKHEDEEYDQKIFNVFRQDKIETQERKVNITTAHCVRDCPEKAREIAIWTRLAKPVLSKAPKKLKKLNQEKAKRDAELDRILAEAVKEMSKPDGEKKIGEKRAATSQPKSVKKKRTSRK